MIHLKPLIRYIIIQPAKASAHQVVMRMSVPNVKHDLPGIVHEDSIQLRANRGTVELNEERLRMIHGLLRFQRTPIVNLHNFKVNQA